MATPNNPGTLHRFFVRTDSTTVLGCEPSQPCHATLEDALPLACQPHLLHPGARREQLFGTAQEHTGDSKSKPLARYMALSRSKCTPLMVAAESAAGGAREQETRESERGMGYSELHSNMTAAN